MCKHMLWKTHLRISFEVLNRLGVSLSPETTQHFREGIIAPDQWQDYPHHYGKSKEIKHHLMKGRGYFLKDDPANAFFHLGVALHYIQDSHTSFASFYPNHHSWEESIENSSFTDHLIKTINYSLSDKDSERKRCLWLAETLSKKAHGRDYTLYLATLTGHEQSKSFAKPIVDLNLAFRASYVITESVLSPKTSSILENSLGNLVTDYAFLMLDAEKELTDKIIRLTNQRETLKNRKVPPSGIVSKIKNGILRIRIGLKDWSVNSNYRNHVQQKHLYGVITDYMNAANRTVTPYVGWNVFQIPQLEPSSVSRELLSVQEVAKALGKNEHTLQKALNNHNISCYFIGDNELVRRQDAERCLSKISVN